MMNPHSSPILSLDLNPPTLAQGLTQSELSLKDECAMKWNLKYNNRLELRDKWSWALWVGTAWHNFQELWRTEGSCELTKHCGLMNFSKNIPRDTDFEMQLEYWTGLLPVYQEVYAKMFEDEKMMKGWCIIEEELSTEYLGFKLRGKIDLANEDFMFIRDFKTTTSAWLISPDGWDFKLQFMMYCWLMVQNYPEWGKKSFKFQLDILQKPGLKQTKADGTWAGHIRRVAADIRSRPEYYLTRQSVDIQPERIKRFQDFVLTPKLQQLALARDNPIEAQSILTNMNTNACNLYGNRCEFWEVCEKGWDVAKFFYNQREVKHQEL